MIILLTVFSN